MALAPLAIGCCVAALLALCALGVVLTLNDDGARPTIIDFDVFHIVGRLVRQDRLADAYAAATMAGLENALGRSGGGYLPYAYPPPFALVMAALAGLSAGPAYATFTAGGVALLAVTLWRLSPCWFWPTVLAMSPALFINVEGGQNGMLTAGLAGLSAALALRSRATAAGATAGLLASLKPQTAIALPLLFTLLRGWRAAAAMVATAVAIGGVAVVALGPAIVPAFLAGLSETGRMLAEGHFPLHRMTSVYACLRTLGAPVGVALALHAITALALFAAIALVGRQLQAPEPACGIALIGTAFVSPYFYDYDLPVVGVGLALVLPTLARASTPRRSICALLAGVALAGSVGILQVLFLSTRLSLGAPILIGWAGVILAMLGGRPSATRGPASGAAESADMPSRHGSTDVPSSTTRFEEMPI